MRNNKIISFKFLAILLPILITGNINSQEYIPNIGIPSPVFGIEEKHTMYESEQYDFGNGLEAYKDAGNGPYTHYIDKADPNATDTDNPYGTLAKPRLTIPQNIEAGSVVEIHNGPYDNSQSIHGATYLPLNVINGTAERPVFIRGANDSTRFEIGGNNQVLVRYANYVIIENMFLNGPSIKVYQPTNHLTIRNSEITGENSSGIVLWTWKAEFTPGDLKENIVIYNNKIHDNGVYPATEETGEHGLMIDNATQNVWIINNEIYYNGDDGIQIIDRYWLPEFNNKYQADRIFISGNKFHHDGENAIDVKGATNIIISQNEIYGYETIFGSSAGEAVRINDEGHQENIWILYNHIYDSQQAINPLQSLAPPYIIGNIIHDCVNAIRYDAGHVVNNVIYNCDMGIEEATNSVVNNIVVNVLGDPIKDNTPDISNNLLWQNGQLEICTDCIIEDPKFVDADNNDFRLKSNSPAIDAGISSPVYDIFKNLYGIDIKYDYAGELRPQGNHWDIGAFEQTTGTFPTQYKLEINTDGFGQVHPPGGEYVEGTDLTLTAIPDDDYEFSGWEGDLIGTENPVEITMDSNMAVTANFVTTVKYDLSINVSGSGVVNHNGGTYDSGELVVLSAIAEEGWMFDGWSGDLASKISPVVVNITSNMSVTANFSLLTSTIEDLDIISVSASDVPEPENGPENTIDDSLGTRWSAEGDQWISYDLGADFVITFVDLAWHRGDTRFSIFDVEISDDSLNWVKVFEGRSTGTTAEKELVDFEDTIGRYVRIYGHGNSSNSWNSLDEIDIYGHSDVTDATNHSDNVLPSKFVLNNYPNPFNPTTTVNYSLPKSSHVQLSIYDMSGQKVKDLYRGYKRPGNYKIVWNAINNYGSKVASGLYFLRLKSELYNKTIKLTLLK